jgi:hypothetical protein
MSRGWSIIAAPRHIIGSISMNSGNDANQLLFYTGSPNV